MSLPYWFFWLDSRTKIRPRLMGTYSMPYDGNSYVCSPAAWDMSHGMKFQMGFWIHGFSSISFGDHLGSGFLK